MSVRVKRHAFYLPQPFRTICYYNQDPSSRPSAKANNIKKMATLPETVTISRTEILEAQKYSGKLLLSVQTGLPGKRTGSPCQPINRIGGKYLCRIWEQSQQLLSAAIEPDSKIIGFRVGEFAYNVNLTSISGKGYCNHQSRGEGPVVR